MTRTARHLDPLLERQAELAAIDAVLDDAVRGAGGTLVVAGPAGIGKTRLLDAARTAATGRGFQVLAARASPLEREFGFGVVRGLVEPAVRAMPPGERATLLNGAARLAQPVLEPVDTPGSPTFATLHGVYWLLVALAERQPLLIAVDDAHWADGPSLRALTHLARRIENLPLLLALTMRPSEPGAAADLLDAVVAEPTTAVLRPNPLSAEATGVVVRRILGEEIDATFDAACHEVAAGNPMLLGALVRSLHQAGIPPTADGTAAVRERAPAIVTAFVLPRLRQLPRSAAAVARALAVLGPGAALRHVATIAGLDPAAAAEAIDQLVAAELVSAGPPLAFAHPLLGQAVAERMPASERLAAHAAAARELSTDGAAAEAVAAHLLVVEPLRDGWVVQRLRAAARSALGKGAPQAAVTYLERALAEPPAPELRAEVLFELGAAQTHLGPAEGFARLEQALALTAEPTARARVALRLARGLETAWELPRALAVLQRALHEADTEPGLDAETRLLLEAEFIGLARSRAATRSEALERMHRLSAHARPDSVAGCLLLAAGAVEELQLVGRTAEAVKHAEQALTGAGRRGGSFVTGVLYLAAPVLAAAGELDRAIRAADAAVREARQRAAPVELGAALASRAEMGRRRGGLLDAEADVRLSQDLARQTGAPYTQRLLLGTLIPILVERGEFAAAERELAELEGTAQHVNLRAAVGALRMAQDRPAEAVEALLASGSRLAMRGWVHPGLVPWETGVALAYHRLGRLDQARELADTALARAVRFAAPVAHGIALRATGLIRGDLEALRAAVDVLAGTAARLEYAHALVELGAALRRVNRRTDAREPLRDGLELAHRCGAAALTGRASDELAAAGARPRNPLRTGVEALSPSERRVARLAADGLSNRDIAQALFVTTKTVEVHLSSCYRKLGVAGRAELPATLG